MAQAPAQIRQPGNPPGRQPVGPENTLVQASAPPQEPSTFRVHSEIVLLGVTARDSEGRPVEGMTRDSFEVFEDGRPQKIVHFEERESPQAIVLAIDVSSSMKDGLLEEARRAALELVRHFYSRGEMAVLAFNHEVKLVCPFTKLESELREGILGLQASGGTALLDGLARGIDLVRRHEYGRQVVVLLTDGKDQDSRAGFDEIDREIAGSGVLVYSIGVYDPFDRKNFLSSGQYLREPYFEQNLNPVWVLRHCADLTGGLSFFPDGAGSLSPVFGLIGNDLSHFYRLGYLPPPSEKPRFRRISVILSGHDSAPEVTLRTRRGYYR